MGSLNVHVEVAVCEELLHTEVGLACVDVRPMGDIKFLINCEPPLLSLRSNATVISLRPKVVSVDRVALRLLVEVLHLLNVVLVHLGADYIFTEATTSGGQ